MLRRKLLLGIVPVLALAVLLVGLGLASADKNVPPPGPYSPGSGQIVAPNTQPEKNLVEYPDPNIPLTQTKSKGPATPPPGLLIFPADEGEAIPLPSD